VTDGPRADIGTSFAFRFVFEEADLLGFSGTRNEMEGRQMSEAIIEATTRILNALGGNGVSSVKELSRETGLKPREVERAIGWLAREKKVHFVQNEGKEQVSLSAE
jgi:hypothetical protein